MVRTSVSVLLLSALIMFVWSYRQEIAAHPVAGPWLASLREEIERQPLIGEVASYATGMLVDRLAVHSPPSSPFITVRAESGFIEQTVSVTGTLNAVMTVELGSQLPGQIAKRLVDFNESVVRDQPLAELNRDSFVARVDEARASLEMASASVNIQLARLRRAEIDFSDAQARRAILQARVDNARVKVEAAQRDHARQKTLASRNAAATTSVENTQSMLASAEALLREEEGMFAVHAFAIAGAKVDMERLRSELVLVRATVAQREALLQIARIDLERTTIRSPIDGVVVGRAVNVGQIIATGLEARTLFVIARDLSEMEIHARVDEADIGKIQAGQRATYTVDAYPGRRFEATVRQVRRAPQINQNIVTYTVVLTAANPQNMLLPGMTAVLRITTGREGPALTVPLAALRYVPASQAKSNPEFSAAGPRVWILRESDVFAVNVKLGAHDDNNVAVLQGSIDSGDQVVIGEARSAPQNRVLGIRLGL